MTTALPLQHRCEKCGSWWSQAHVCLDQMLKGQHGGQYTFAATVADVECLTCGLTFKSSSVHHCPGRRLLSENDVRRIVREELAAIERSKPSTDNP